MHWLHPVMRFLGNKDAARLAATCVGMHETKAKRADHVDVTPENVDRVVELLREGKIKSLGVNPVRMGERREAISAALQPAIMASPNIEHLALNMFHFSEGMTWPRTLKTVTVAAAMAPMMSFDDTAMTWPAIETLITDPALSACRVSIRSPKEDLRLWEVMPRAVNLVSLEFQINKHHNVPTICRLAREAELEGRVFDLFPPCLQTADISIFPDAFDESTEADYRLLCKLLEREVAKAAVDVRLTITSAPTDTTPMRSRFFQIGCVHQVHLFGSFMRTNTEHKRIQDLVPRTIRRLTIIQWDMLAPVKEPVDLPFLAHVTLRDSKLVTLTGLTSLKTLTVVHQVRWRESQAPNMTVDPSCFPASLTDVHVKLIDTYQTPCEVIFSCGLPDGVAKVVLEHTKIPGAVMFLTSEHPAMKTAFRIAYTPGAGFAITEPTPA